MTRLIGTTWKRSNALSEGVLIARFLLGNLEIILPTKSVGRSEIKFKCLYSSSLSWWFVAGVTPLPIPNREVKPCRTDDSPSGAKVGSCQDCELEYFKLIIQKAIKKIYLRDGFLFLYREIYHPWSKSIQGKELIEAFFRLWYSISMSTEQPNNSIENIQREKYNEIRKEIEDFKDLPESEFYNERSNMGDLLDVDEARKNRAHAILTKIEDQVHSKGLTPEQQIELQHLWEKEVLGFKEARKMYSGDGAEM